MPSKDRIHQQVKAALEKDGWQITEDPLFVPVQGLAGLYIDLAAREIWRAQKNGRHIVIEIKDFAGQSFTRAFYEALGQVLVYEKALAERGVDWPLFLAIPVEAYQRLEKIPLFMQILQYFAVNLLIIDLQQQTVAAWQTQKNTKI